MQRRMASFSNGVKKSESILGMFYGRLKSVVKIMILWKWSFMSELLCKLDFELVRRVCVAFVECT